MNIVVLSGVMAGIARAQELDAVFPGAVAGYDSAFGVVARGRDALPQPVGVQWAGLSLAPGLKLDAGYDSAPDGGNGSILLGLTPNMTLRDNAAGFAGYGSVSVIAYPQASNRNVTSYSLGLGERAALPRETLIITGGVAGGQQNGFTLNDIVGSKSISYNLESLRLSDDVDAAMFRFTPEISLTAFRLAGFASQDYQDQRAALTSLYQPGGPVSYVMRLQGSQLQCRDALLNAATEQVLTGFKDTQSGLWTVQALAGVVQRRPLRGPVTTAPMLEWRVDWRPTGLDQLRVELTHEIDNQNQLSATPDILTEGHVALTHDISRDLSLKLAATLSDARFIASPDHETLFSSEIGMRWQVDPWIALDGSYVFNDRQANFEAAANQHVVMAGIAWMP